MKLHERIRERQKYLGFKDHEIAEYLGVDRVTYTTIASGIRKVKTDELQKLAKLFSCTSDYLLTGKTEVKTNLGYLDLHPNDVKELKLFAEFLSMRRKNGRNKKSP